MTVKTRLLAALAVVAVGVISIGGSGAWAAWVGKRQIDTIVADRVAPLQQLKIVSDMYAVNIVDTAHKARAGAITFPEALDSLTRAKTAIRDNWTAYASTDKPAEEQAMADEVRQHLPAADAAVAEMEAILRSGDRAALGAFADTRLYPAIDPVTAAVSSMVDLEARLAAEAGAEAGQVFGVANTAATIIGLSALLVLVLTTVFVVRGVAGPLQALTDAMRRLAGGDNSIRVPADNRRDELGEMARALAAFRDAAVEKLRMEAEAAQAREQAEIERRRNLTATEAQAEAQALVVNSLADGLARLSRGELTCAIEAEFPGEYAKLRTDFNAAVAQLRDAMSVVVANIGAIRSGAGEISQAADDLSRRTEQQAASLEQTAAALDQITATVNRTASGAREASDTVKAAKADAETSGSVVRDAVTAMGAIEKSAREISQIIGVIDEIAFQTNLLALNAGVEAARAGEAGRGFAVVATEVRGLAQRSAEAAKEIKALITSSTAQVGSGVALVGQTGEALERIVTRVAGIDTLVTEIAASAQEQAIGLAEVNTAVNQMDQVTQQNAAMVEQTTAASHSLSREAGALADSVGRFNVGGGAAAAAPSRPAARPAAPVAPVAQLRATGRGGAALKPAPAANSDDWEEF
jgi:methyl-accepting chemotaxis protein